FEFVEGNCDLSIVQLAREPSLADLARIVAVSPPAPPPAEDETLSFAALADTVKAETPARSVAPAPEPKPAQPTAPALSLASVEETEDRRTGPEDRRGAGVQSIRVDLDKVDRVVNMVGELVITQS